MSIGEKLAAQQRECIAQSAEWARRLEAGRAWAYQRNGVAMPEDAATRIRHVLAEEAGDRVPVRRADLVELLETQGARCGRGSGHDRPPLPVPHA